MDRKEKLHQLIDEYRNMQIPSEMYERLQDSMIRGKKEATKRRRRRFIRNWSASVAAIFMLAILLPNIHADIAYAMGRIPMVGEFFKVVTIRDYHYEDEFHEANADIPFLAMQSVEESESEALITSDYDCADMDESRAEEEIAATDTAEEIGRVFAEKERGTETADAIEEVNADVDRYIQMLLDRFEAERAEHAEGHLALDITYDVVVDRDNWFTLVIYGVETQASGYEFRKYYNIDKTSGKVIELAELFDSETDYVTLINEEICRQMQDAMKADPEVVYFVEADEWSDGFQGIKEDQNFYLNEHEDLVIVFDEYEVAPGSSGCPEFVIHKELLH